MHLSLSAATAPHVEEFLTALRGAVDGAVVNGPVAVDPEVADFVQALDAATLTDADFDGLLAAAGLLGDGLGGARPPRRDGTGERAARPRRTRPAGGAADRFPGPTAAPGLVRLAPFVQIADRRDHPV